MLDHHPQVACLDEFDFVLDTLNPDGTEPDPTTLRERLQAERGYRFSGFQLPATLDFAASMRALFDNLMSQASAGKRVVGVTFHRHCLETLRYWPEAKFIHLVRDPRDVAPSVIAMGWAGTAWHATRFWLDAEEEVDRLKTVLAPERIVKIRFEDLVSRPVEELTRLCDLLGVAYDPLMLSYPANSTYPPPDSTAAARWKGRMVESDVRQVEQRTLARMIAHGYEPSGLPPLRLGAFQRWRMALSDRVYRFRWGLKTYGAVPVVTSAVASRLGLSSVAARARCRMQEIEMQNLR
jgi:hypothetical protein